MSNSLQAFKDSISVMTTGMTKAEAHAQNVCVKCRKRPDFTKGGTLDPESVGGVLSVKEYGISGYCPACWDELFADEEEGDADVDDEDDEPPSAEQAADLQDRADSIREGERDAQAEADFDPIRDGWTDKNGRP